jgi:hypothetical protein
MTPIKKPGRPPANPSEGPARNYTVRLTPLQALRALSFGVTVNHGINNLLRESAPEIKGN